MRADLAMGQFLSWIFEPGFFDSQPVHVAILIGSATAIVSAIVGVFTVMRGQSFAGHALTDVSTAGGSGAFLLGLSPLFGFVGLGVVGACVMELIGIRRVRGRDLATGIILGASIGLAALLLYLDTSSGATTGATQQILFGSIFTIETSTIPIVISFSVIALVIIAAVYRPLLLSSVSNDIAAAKGVSLRLIGLLFMLALAVSVGLSSLTIGAILSTALLVGPAATALRMTARLGVALIVACVIGIGVTWLGVLLAYDSYYWGSSRQGFPVSFFIVALVFVLYVISGFSGIRAVTSRRERAVLRGAEA
ncbi:MAG: metal ABC transporter permease [Candidatus Dormiibacterota bacterium]